MIGTIYCPHGKKDEALELLSELYAKYSTVKDRVKRLGYLGAVTSLQSAIHHGTILENQTLYVEAGTKIVDDVEHKHQLIEYVNYSDHPQIEINMPEV